MLDKVGDLCIMDMRNKKDSAISGGIPSFFAVSAVKS